MASMPGKYSDLPDIDHAADIFETADEVEVTFPREEEMGDETGKKSALASRQDLDQSELPSRRKAHEVFALDSSAAPPFLGETQLSRLRRLQAEVAELEKEVLHQRPSDGLSVAAPKRRPVPPPRQPVDLVTELSTLREKLNAATGNMTFENDSNSSEEWHGRLQRLELVPDKTARPTTFEPMAEVASPQPQAGSVDKRLATLEQLVGVSPGEGNKSMALGDSIARIDTLLTVLTQPRHLDSISRRIKLLLVDLDRASTNSRKPGSTSSGPDQAISSSLSQADQQALQLVFSVLPRLDPIIPTIPMLVTRLRSLSGLHAEALDIAADLRELQATDGRVTEEDRELRDVVDGVQQGMAEAATGISKNWESLQERVGSLENRLRVLSA